MRKTVGTERILYQKHAESAGNIQVIGGEEIGRKATDHDSSGISSRHINSITISRQKSAATIKSLW